jgi:hypothetical protein
MRVAYTGTSPEAKAILLDLRKSLQNK